MSTFAIKDHTITHTSNLGARNTISIASIANIYNEEEYLVVNTGGFMTHLEFANLTDLNAAWDEIELQMNRQKILEGGLFSYSPKVDSLAPEDYLDTFITVPEGVEVYLYMGLTHAGPITETLYVGTEATGGTPSDEFVHNLNSSESHESTWVMNPTIVDLGTPRGPMIHLGQDDQGVGVSSGRAPAFILPEGTYLFRAQNESGYWAPVQRKIQFYEEDV